MAHGAHCDCMACKMGKGVGMIKKHSDGCDCQKDVNSKEEDNSKGS